MKAAWVPYRLIGLVGFAQRRRGAVDLFDHTGEVFAHVVETFGKFFSKFVTVQLGS